MNVRSMTFTALLAAVICVLAPISFPVGPIPITLALFAIYITSSLTNWKLGTLSVCVYILIGAVGVPVFSGYGGGLQRLVSVTGGYLWGYIPMAMIIGLLIDRFEEKKFVYPLAMVLGTAVCYFLGTAWYMYLTKSPLMTALITCVTPFLIGDVIKIILASLVAYPVRKILKKRGIA